MRQEREIVFEKKVEKEVDKKKMKSKLVSSRQCYN